MESKVVNKSVVRVFVSPANAVAKVAKLLLNRGLDVQCAVNDHQDVGSLGHVIFTEHVFREPFKVDIDRRSTGVLVTPPVSADVIAFAYNTHISVVGAVNCGKSTIIQLLKADILKQYEDGTYRPDIVVFSMDGPYNGPFEVDHLEEKLAVVKDRIRIEVLSQPRRRSQPVNELMPPVEVGDLNTMYFMGARAIVAELHKQMVDGWASELTPEWIADLLGAIARPDSYAQYVVTKDREEFMISSGVSAPVSIRTHRPIPSQE